MLSSIRRASNFFTSSRAKDEIEISEVTPCNVHDHLRRLRDTYDEKSDAFLLYLHSKTTTMMSKRSGNKIDTPESGGDANVNYAELIAPVIVSEKDYGLMATASNTFLRSNICTKYLYLGTLLGEWFLLQAHSDFMEGNAEGIIKPSTPTKQSRKRSTDSGDLHSKKLLGTDLYRIVVRSLTNQIGVDDLEFKVITAKSHVEIHRRQGLLSEPIHLNKAYELLFDCYQQYKKQNMAEKYILSAVTRLRDEIDKMRSMEKKDLKVEAARARRDSTAIPSMSRKMSYSTGISADALKAAMNTREKKKFDLNDPNTVRYKRRQEVIQLIPTLYMSVLQYLGHFEDVIPICKECIEWAEKRLNKLIEHVGEELLEEEELPISPGPQSIELGSTAHLSVEEEIKIEAEHQMLRHKKRAVLHARQEVSYFYCLLAAMHVGLSEYSSAIDQLDVILNNTKTPPAGLSIEDLEFIKGRCIELKVEKEVLLDHPMDGYLDALERNKKARHAAEVLNLKARQMKELEEQEWQRMADAAAAAERDQEALKAEIAAYSSPTNKFHMNRSPTSGSKFSYHDDDQSQHSNNNNNNGDEGEKETPDINSNSANKVVAPELDLEKLKAERLRVKQENFRRRKELRKLRKMGIRPEVEDPEAAERELQRKKLRSEAKKWLSSWRIWSNVGDKFQYLGFFTMAQDCYRQGILRDNIGYSLPKLWLRWAKACHLCGRLYDTKLALNQAQHFDPESEQIFIFRKHYHLVGGTKSDEGENREGRTSFDYRINCGAAYKKELDSILDRQKAEEANAKLFGKVWDADQFDYGDGVIVDDGGFSATNSKDKEKKMLRRVRHAIFGMRSLVDILGEMTERSNLEIFRDYAAARVSAFVKRVAHRNKTVREAKELKRLERLWASKPAKTPTLVWEQPEPRHYPVYLSSEGEGCILNACAPMMPDTPRSELNDIDFNNYDDSQSDLGQNSSIIENSASQKDIAAIQEGEEGSEEDSASLESLSTQDDNIEGEMKYTPKESQTSLNAGHHELRVCFIPEDLGRYTKAYAVVHLTVLKAEHSPGIVWPQLEAQYVGTPLGEAQLGARVRFGRKDTMLYTAAQLKEGSKVPLDERELRRPTAAGMGGFGTGGILQFSHNPGDVLPVGKHTLTATYTPYDIHNYNGVTKSRTFVVKPYLPEVVWDTPLPISYPTKLTKAGQLNARCVDQLGTFVYTPSRLDDPLPAGTHTLQCSFWPYDHTRYGIVNIETSLIVNRTVPIIKWDQPPHIYIGDTLTYEDHLNASIVYQARKDCSNPTGVFRYTVDTYSRFRPGHYTLKTLFFPDDLDNYEFSEATARLTVRCKPRVKWEELPIVRVGNPLTEEILCAYCKECTGVFIYDPPLGYVTEREGVQDFKVEFVPDDESIFDRVHVTINIEVIQKLNPSLSWEPANVVYGNVLSAENALSAVAEEGLEGRWVYKGEGIGQPKDQKGAEEAARDGKEAEGKEKEEEEDTITQNTIILSSGKYVMQATFIPLDLWNYNEGSLVKTIVVEKLPVDLAYGPFPDLYYGDALTKALHCTASITGYAANFLPNDAAISADSTFGTFHFNQSPNAILKAGTHDLVVKYTPIDKTNFEDAEVTVPLKIKRHEPVVDWPNPKAIRYSELLTTKHLNAAIRKNSRDINEKITGELTYSHTTGHRFPNVGRHKLEMKFVPEDGFNYSTIELTREISVRRYPIQVFWERPEEIFEGAKLTEEQLNATTNFPDLTDEDGRLFYDPPAGKKLESGEHTLLCTFKPAAEKKDNFDLRNAYCEVQMFVAPTRGGMKSRGR